MLQSENPNNLIEFIRQPVGFGIFLGCDSLPGHDKNILNKQLS